MRITRRRLLTAAGFSAATVALPSGAQGVWPSRPVKLVSPYGAGGASDISARILAERLGRSFGQQFIVENKPGAGTRLANEMVARAQPDGYTILYAAAPYATAEALYGKLGFDPRKDMTPVTLAVRAPLFLIVNADSGIKSVQEFIAYGKKRPGGINFGSPGAGSQPNLAAELLLRDAKVPGVNVHFRGDALAYNDLLGGRIDATLTAITTALPHIQSGKLRVLGVASAARSPLYPEARTLREQGLPNVIASGWYGFMVPAATPRMVVARLQAEINAILGQADVKQKLLDVGLEALGGTPAEFSKFIESESVKWADLIRKTGIKGD